MKDSNLAFYGIPTSLIGSFSCNAKIKPENPSSRGLFAVRKGDWKLIEGKGSGRFSLPFDEKSIQSEVPGQLYNLRTDTAESNNLYAKEQAKVAELTFLLDSIRKVK